MYTLRICLEAASHIFFQPQTYTPLNLFNIPPEVFFLKNYINSRIPLESVRCSTFNLKLINLKVKNDLSQKILVFRSSYTSCINTANELLAEF